MAVSFWDLRLNPPPDSRRREGEDKAFSLGTEGEGAGQGERLTSLLTTVAYLWRFR